MMSETRRNPPFLPDTRLLGLFVDWLEQFDKQHAVDWARRYKDNPEAAMCEATFWGILTDCGVDVEPNADLLGNSQAPDFFCQSNGYQFYLEATCIKIATASERTGLAHEIEASASTGMYQSLNKAIFDKCTEKTPQCASVDAPCLLGIGTFHSKASVYCVRKWFLQNLLTGEQSIGMDFDAEEGRAIGAPYSTTGLWPATFLKPSEKGIAEARCPISAILIGGFGILDKPPIFGALHPAPAYEFDRTVLDRIEFCRIANDYSKGELHTEWI